MDLPLLHDLQRFQSVVSVIGLVPVAGEVDVQGGYDIPVIITDENVVQQNHSSCLLSYQPLFKPQGGKGLRSS